MENASKALLIAAGVLIAILILTLFSYLMRQMGSSTSGIYSKLSQREITEFNQKFLNYEGRGIYSVGKDNEGNDLYILEITFILIEGVILIDILNIRNTA